MAGCCYLVVERSYSQQCEQCIKNSEQCKYLIIMHWRLSNITFLRCLPCYRGGQDVVIWSLNGAAGNSTQMNAAASVNSEHYFQCRETERLRKCCNVTTSDQMKSTNMIGN